MGSSKNKKKDKGSKKKDKKDKKKSKTSSTWKNKGKKGKKDKHPQMPKISPHGPGKGPDQKKRGKGELVAVTPPMDGHWQQGGPGGPSPQPHPGAVRAQQLQQQQQQQLQQLQQQKMMQQQAQQAQNQQGARAQPPVPGQGPPIPAKGAVRSSQTLSAESMPGMHPPQQQKRPPQQQQPQQGGGAAPRPAPAARPPPPQQMQQRPTQQQPLPQQARPGLRPQKPSPDMDKTEKKKGKQGAGSGSKISKFLDIKFASVIDQHRKFLGTLPNSVSRAAFDDNLCLNRFEDVICIDQTRVLFSDSSLYLNANWVAIEPGKKPEDPPKKMAIVAQLPLPECKVAFWTMVAENDIKGVLLFCDDNEFLSFGADQIFPVNKATVQISPRITVTHTHRLAVSAEWTMNVYLMCMGDVRKYVHVHCYAWGGDENIKLTELWQLESVFRKYSSPHVYMSSAGVGRASTFAALKMVHARMHDDTCKEVNLNSCIVSLREHRLHSIQSLTQSITLHSALIQHIIDCPTFEKLEHDPRVRTFAEQYKDHMANSKE